MASGAADPEIEWSPVLHAFTFACEHPEFAAILGSPSAVVNETEPASNYAASSESSFRLGISQPGEDHELIVLSASAEGGGQLESVYQNLIARADDFPTESAAYYKQNLSRTVALDIPDPKLQQAFDWARINMDKPWPTIRFKGRDSLRAMG
jgi:hypothetical protein